MCESLVNNRGVNKCLMVWDGQQMPLTLGEIVISEAGAQQGWCQNGGDEKCNLNSVVFAEFQKL